MKIVNAVRDEIYPIIGECFSEIKINPTIVEIGVCKGVNLENLINSLNPISTVLVDQWIPYSPFKDALPGSELYNAGSKYFGGAVDDPATYENLYTQCKNKFLKNSNNIIIRKDSIVAAEELHNLNVKFDFVYIDGGHLYEEVLTDLTSYEKLLTPDGMIMLDDFVNSDEGKMQNLGVVEAVNTFLKENKNYQPTLITRSTGRAWCNILLTKKNSSITTLIDKYLVKSKIFFVETPDSILHFISNSPNNNCVRFNET
jgi:hypothetical protein